MSREDLKDIIARVLDRLAPTPACVYGDAPCDATTRYAIGEEG
jgi:hypothetical protein